MGSILRRIAFETGSRRAQLGIVSRRASPVPSSLNQILRSNRWRLDGPRVDGGQSRFRYSPRSNQARRFVVESRRLAEQKDSLAAAV